MIGFEVRFPNWPIGALLTVTLIRLSVGIIIIYDNVNQDKHDWYNQIDKANENKQQHIILILHLF